MGRRGRECGGVGWGVVCFCVGGGRAGGGQPVRAALAQYYRDLSLLSGYGEEEAERAAVQAVWMESTLVMYEVQDEGSDYG